MKTIMVFNDSSEGDVLKLQDCLQATAMKLALSEIGDKVFRPARKHGYPDNSDLNDLLNKEEVCEAIGILEEKFYEILRDRGVTLE